MNALLTNLMLGVFFPVTLLMWNILPASAKDADKAVLLRRDWPSGHEYKLRCRWESDLATLGKGGVRMGGRLGHMTTSEFTLGVWPVPNGGRMYGLHWTAVVHETRFPGGATTFDSRKPVQTQKSDAVWGWDMIGNAWSYFDENGDFTGKTGLGHGIGLRHDSPYASLSSRDKGSLFYRICALESLPEEPVPVGHHWTANVSGDHHAFGDANAKVDFEFRRIETLEGRECAVVGFRASLSKAPEPDEQSRPESSKKKWEIDETSLGGDIWLDTSAGLTVKAAGRSVISARMDGAPVTQRTTDTMEMTLLSTDAIDPAAPLPPPLRTPEAHGLPPTSAMKTMALEERPPGPGEVVLRVAIKPNTRTLLTHSVSQAIRLDLAGRRQDAMRFRMVDEFEDVVRSGGNPGETLHESRWLARRTEVPDAAGLSYDSRKLEAGDEKVDPSAVEDWMNVRKMKVFMLRGPDGKPLRSWSDGKGARSPNSPLAAQAMENSIEVRAFSPEHFPKEPIAPGTTWPLNTTMNSVGIADEIAVTGNYTLQSVEMVNGRRLAVVHFSGVMAPADTAAPPKPGSGVVEKGRVEGAYTIDLDNNTWVHRRIRNEYTSRIQVPGGRQGFRQEIDLEVEQTYHSIDPLPPTP